MGDNYCALCGHKIPMNGLCEHCNVSDSHFNISEEEKNVMATIIRSTYWEPGPTQSDAFNEVAARRLVKKYKKNDLNNPFRGDIRQELQQRGFDDTKINELLNEKPMPYDVFETEQFSTEKDYEKNITRESLDRDTERARPLWRGSASVKANDDSWLKSNDDLKKVLESAGVPIKRKKRASLIIYNKAHPEFKGFAEKVKSAFKGKIDFSIDSSKIYLIEPDIEVRLVFENIPSEVISYLINLGMSERKLRGYEIVDILRGKGIVKTTISKMITTSYLTDIINYFTENLFVLNIFKMNENLNYVLLTFNYDKSQAKIDKIPWRGDLKGPMDVQEIYPETEEGKIFRLYKPASRPENTPKSRLDQSDIWKNSGKGFGAGNCIIYQDKYTQLKGTAKIAITHLQNNGYFYLTPSNVFTSKWYGFSNPVLMKKDMDRFKAIMRKVLILNIIKMKTIHFEIRLYSNTVSIELVNSLVDEMNKEYLSLIDYWSSEGILILQFMYDESAAKKRESSLIDSIKKRFQKSKNNLIKDESYRKEVRNICPRCKKATLLARYNTNNELYEYRCSACDYNESVNDYSGRTAQKKDTTSDFFKRIFKRISKLSEKEKNEIIKKSGDSLLNDPDYRKRVRDICPRCRQPTFLARYNNGNNSNTPDYYECSSCGKNTKRRFSWLKSPIGLKSKELNWTEIAPKFMVFVLGMFLFSWALINFGGGDFGGEYWTFAIIGTIIGLISMILDFIERKQERDGEKKIVDDTVGGDGAPTPTPEGPKGETPPEEEEKEEEQKQITGKTMHETKLLYPSEEESLANQRGVSQEEIEKARKKYFDE
ncbi:MAG: hypothetical protein ABIF85_07110 [Nanoarchaeota archaeon]|nr:hypothetical protein [Nanoarchaeota archaeon]MBU4300546.1 hypothetical protein [Nanoarchaeota archaeon]MBU4452080.1 hypothetical protein [Nanoarchaeota archaeon]MCG2724187.1 hypothetical protein [archaeon]